MKGDLICLIGTDGSGKSTIADMLEKELLLLGADCKRVWGGYELKLLKGLVKAAKFILLKHSSPYGDYSNYKMEMQTVSNNIFVSKSYTLLVFCEYWAQLFYKVVFPMRVQKKAIICDRYIYDTVINISDNMGDRKGFLSRLNLWTKLFAKPDLIIYVHVPPEVSMARKDDIPDREYLESRIHYYEVLHKRLNVEKIDGTRSIESIENQIAELAKGLHHNG